MPPDMPAAKLRPVGAENHGAPAGHVFAAVIADAFDDGLGAAVAHAEPLGRAAAEERAAARRAVQRDVADEDVLLGLERRDLRRIDDRSGRPKVPCRRSRWLSPSSSSVMPFARNAPKLCPAVPVNLKRIGVVGQRVGAPLLDDLVAQHRADGAVRCSTIGSSSRVFLRC